MRYQEIDVKVPVPVLFPKQAAVIGRCRFESGQGRHFNVLGFAGVAQPIERGSPKAEATGSIPVIRTTRGRRSTD